MFLQKNTVASIPLLCDIFRSINVLSLSLQDTSWIVNQTLKLLERIGKTLRAYSKQIITVFISPNVQRY